MIRLYIDGQEAEIRRDRLPEIDVSFDELCDPARVQEKRYPFLLPATPRNDALLGYPAEPFSADRYNRQDHPARVEADGTTLLKGSAHLTGCETADDRSGTYRVEIVVPLPGWIASASQKLLRETDLPCEAILTGDLIRESWYGDSPVRFFPVQRDRYDLPAYETETPPVRPMTCEDYHPFFRIKTVLDAIVGAAGYAIRSEFLESDDFGSLYMSGYYPARDIDLLKSRINFFAARFGESTAAANEYGAVYASPYQPSHTVGNLVDTADPYRVQDGKRIEGAFSNGNCFRQIDLRPGFTPSEDVVLGFEYRLRFRSSFRVVSSTRLAGFDKIRLDDGATHDIPLVNPLEDHRNGGTLTGSYTLVNFAFDPVPHYRLVIDYTDGSTETIVIRLPQEEISIAKPFAKAALFRGSISGDGEEPGDWAFYLTQDYTDIPRNLEIDVTLRSRPSLCKGNATRFFDNVTFSGAEPGTPLTLLGDTSLRPVFYVNPMEGSKVSANELFAHEQKQIELFRALAHLFRLCFYTDELSRTIHIEPYGTFADPRAETDWTEKRAQGFPITIRETGDDMPRSVVLLYRDDDGTVMRWNEANKKKFARQRMEIENRFARPEEENAVNPLFSPSMNRTGSVPQARSASLLCVGNRDRRKDNYDDGDLNFAPKIVRWLGLRPLAENETWGWPTFGKEYPLVAFHYPDPAEGFTLCFDDFEGQSGLRAYHDPYFSMLNHGRRLTLRLFPEAHDMENLLFPNGLKRDFRGFHTFVFRGEKIRCRLESVKGYAPGSGKPALFTFLKES